MRQRSRGAGRDTAAASRRKIVLARWIEAHVQTPSPSRNQTISVDIGAKADIYHLLQLLAQRDWLCCSSPYDFEEVERVCHHALVFQPRAGRRAVPGHA